MKFSITIGSYLLTDFVALNIEQCRRIFGDDIQILVSDDRSPKSEEIEQVALERGCSYIVGEKRHSHFTGDLQAFINCAKFGELTEADVCLKISQRFIPLDRSFVDVISAPFKDPEVVIVLPGQPDKRQLARPGVGFYAGFGLLTDFAAWRPSALPGETIEKVYRERMSDVSDTRRGKHMVEVTMGWILANVMKGKSAILRNLANHEIGKPKLYLRKSQSNIGEYVKLAASHGMTGQFPVAEWSQIEGKAYVPMSTII